MSLVCSQNSDKHIPIFHIVGRKRIFTSGHGTCKGYGMSLSRLPLKMQMQKTSSRTGGRGRRSNLKVQITVLADSVE